MAYSDVPCPHCGTKGEYRRYVEDDDPRAECESCGNGLQALWLMEQAKKLHPMDDSHLPDEIASEHWVPPHVLNKDHTVDLPKVDVSKYKEAN